MTGKLVGGLLAPSSSSSFPSAPQDGTKRETRVQCNQPAKNQTERERHKAMRAEWPTMTVNDARDETSRRLSFELAFGT